MITYRTCHFCAFARQHPGTAGSALHGEAPESGLVECCSTGIRYYDDQVPSGCHLYARPEELLPELQSVAVLVWPVRRSAEVTL